MLRARHLSRAGRTSCLISDRMSAQNPCWRSAPLDAFYGDSHVLHRVSPSRLGQARAWPARAQRSRQVDAPQGAARCRTAQRRPGPVRGPAAGGPADAPARQARPVAGAGGPAHLRPHLGGREPRARRPCLRARRRAAQRRRGRFPVSAVAADPRPGRRAPLGRAAADGGGRARPSCPARSCCSSTSRPRAGAADRRGPSAGNCAGAPGREPRPARDEQNVDFARACTDRLYLIDSGTIVFSGRLGRLRRAAGARERVSGAVRISDHERSRTMKDPGAGTRGSTLAGSRTGARAAPGAPARSQRCPRLGDPRAGPDLRPDGRHALNYGEALLRAERLAAGLWGLGLRPGYRLAFQLPNWLEAVAVDLACALIGEVVVPIVPIYRGAEVAQALADSRAKAIIVPERFRNFDYAAMLRDPRPVPCPT